MTNDECRMTKEARNSKSAIRNKLEAPNSSSPTTRRNFNFELGISDLFRGSSFELRISLVTRPGLICLCAIYLLCTFTARAHVGSPAVFFEGMAGPYRAHVVVRPAEVIPGLADISVRVEGAEVERVTALPMKWNTGRKGAPPPDAAEPVRGETNLYSAQLWFMESGAHSVEIEIAGASGTGRVIVPVDAVATRVLKMPKYLGGMLIVLGLLLLGLLVSIIGAAVRESVVEPGTHPSGRRRWGARAVMAGAAILLTALLWGGKHWWEAEATDYQHNRLYKPLEMRAEVTREREHRILRLEIPRFGGAAFSGGAPAPVVPDHGKLMHLFVVREPALDAFAHLHPVKVDRKTFESVLPELPAGTYRLYADVTYETGWSDTLTNRIEIPAAVSLSSDGERRDGKLADSDDAWSAQVPLAGECGIGQGFVMNLLGPGQFGVNEPVELQFAVRNLNGESVALEPYLGMRGHLVISRDDGAVFTHLHPGGSASMAAMQLSSLRAEGKLPLQAAFGKDDPVCNLPAAGPAEIAWLNGSSPSNSSALSFPYAFPRSGRYRMWVQVRVDGSVRTAVFDVAVRK
jgi:hypothetical protein